MSNAMSIDVLHGIMMACAGGDLGELDGDISGTSFEDLGYDSLALMETAAVLNRDYGIDIPDDEITEMRTPKELLDKINDRIEAGA